MAGICKGRMPSAAPTQASTATVDGDNGLGLVVGPKANEIAIRKAKEAGSGWVVRRLGTDWSACCESKGKHFVHRCGK